MQLRKMAREIFSSFRDFLGTDAVCVIAITWESGDSSKHRVWCRGEHSGWIYLLGCVVEIEPIDVYPSSYSEQYGTPVALRKAQTSEYDQSRIGFTLINGGQPVLLGQNRSCPPAFGSPLQQESSITILLHQLFFFLTDILLCIVNPPTPNPNIQPCDEALDTARIVYIKGWTENKNSYLLVPMTTAFTGLLESKSLKPDLKSPVSSSTCSL